MLLWIDCKNSGFPYYGSVIENAFTSAECIGFLTTDRILFWVAVKELTSSYHVGETC